MMADISDAASHSAQASNQQQSSTQAGDSSARIPINFRLLMQGKEVGSIIGKKGDNIKRFREVSGAKINVSDSSCLDRIVTLSGTLDQIYNAFSMICLKFEEQILQIASSGPSSGGAISAATTTTTTTDSSLGGETKIGASAANVTDPLFGLPSTGLLKNALKDSNSKEADLLTINNNNTTTINNNNLDAPIKNNLTTSPSSATTTTSSSNNNKSNTSHHPSVTTRLIVPASQCGSLIGRGGAKIKEIREVTGATIQVAPDVLPNSTERVVTITGNVESLKSCAYQICKIMIDSPPKGYVIPYRPKPAINPVLLAAATAGQAAAAYNLPGQFGMSAHPDVTRMCRQQLFVANNPLAAAFDQTTLRAAAASGQAAAALSAVAASAQQQQLGSHEMAIPNGLIGCVIGKGGSKINEIRQLSGAVIKISDSEEGTKSRTVTISGSPENISLAQYLINASCNGHQTSLLENMTKPWIANKSARKFAPY